MKIDQVLSTYDAAYAAVYDATFLDDGWTRESVAFQLALLEHQLRGARNWLDVACGTGYVLSRFPQVERAGIDISPSMLAVARERNPGAILVEGDYNDPFPEWNDRWQVVSCMWWAYCFCETMSSLQRFIARLADWTASDGVCFVPLANVQKFDRHNIRLPYIDPRVPGRCLITGVTWSWIQMSGKRHDDMLSPQVEHLAAMFRQHFAEVEIVEGPLDQIGEGWKVQDVLLARGKRADRPSGELYPLGDGDRPGHLEWLFGTQNGSLAGLAYPTRSLKHVRIVIDRIGEGGPSTVRAEKVGYRLERGTRYRITCDARADARRPIAVGMSRGTAPWTSLGLYQEVLIAPEWTTIALEFEAVESSDLARLHFDLGQAAVAIELRDVGVRPAS